MALPRQRRIAKRREIEALLGGRRVRGRSLDLFWREAPAGTPSRAGCITPKYGRSSVERNRLRRRLKEAIREVLLGRAEPREYLVRARPPAYGSTFADLRRALAELAERLDATPTETDVER